MGCGNYVGMALLDVQKAFDCVDHDILCQKLSALGIASTGWFKSYLSERKQVVNINGTLSQQRLITSGVPQGSILGPTLFLCFVNDMPSCVKCRLIQYADDSVLIASGKDPHKISEILSADLKNCDTWLIENKLSLHMGKTELTIFGSKRKLKRISNFTITHRGITVKSSPTVKYLGVKLDQNLSGQDIAMDIIAKSNSRLKYLHRQAENLNKQTKKILCTALIGSSLDYSVSSWYHGTSGPLKKKLQITQNKMLRYIKDWGPMVHVGQTELASENLLNIETRAKQLGLNHMYKIYNNTSPHYLSTSFTKISQIHEHNTRQNNSNFFTPAVNNILSKSFHFSGIKFWNSLPHSIKTTPTLGSFKQRVKKHLLQESISSDASPFQY